MEGVALEGTWGELDADSDGQITFNEFMDAAEATVSSLDAIERAAVLFVRSDTDRSGALDRGEMSRLLATAYAEGVEAS